MWKVTQRKKNVEYKTGMKEGIEKRWGCQKTYHEKKSSGELGGA